MHIEAELLAMYKMSRDEKSRRGSFLGLEVKIRQVHAEENLWHAGDPDKVDRDWWRP